MALGSCGNGWDKWRWVGMGMYEKGRAYMRYLPARIMKHQSHMAIWRPTDDRDSIAKTEITRATSASIT